MRVVRVDNLARKLDSGALNLSNWPPDCSERPDGWPHSNRPRSVPHCWNSVPHWWSSGSRGRSGSGSTTSTAGEASVTPLPERFVRAAAEIPGGRECFPYLSGSPDNSARLQIINKNFINDNALIFQIKFNIIIYYCILIIIHSQCLICCAICETYKFW